VVHPANKKKKTSGKNEKKKKFQDDDDIIFTVAVNQNRITPFGYHFIGTSGWDFFFLGIYQY
jgi:hypothetical protein